MLTEGLELPEHLGTDCFSEAFAALGYKNWLSVCIIYMCKPMPCRSRYIFTSETCKILSWQEASEGIIHGKDDWTKSPERGMKVKRK